MINNKNDIPIIYYDDDLLLNEDKFIPIGDTLEQILNHINEKKQIILLVGQVQSGKTNSIIELIKKAFLYYEYDYVFYLAGTNNNLSEQSKKRIEESLSEINCSIQYNEFNIERSSQIRELFILMKNCKKTEKMKKFFEDHIDLTKKILILDDESDYASVMTKYNKIANIFRNINYCYEQINNGGLVYITATPYANILTSFNKNSISLVGLLKTNEDYTGLDFFNKLNNFYICPNILEDQNYYRKYIFYSIYLWLIKSYLYFNNELENQYSDLLIYIDDNTKHHKKIEEIAKANINKIVTKNYEIDEFKKIIDENNINIEIDKFENWIDHEFHNYINVLPIVINSKNDSKYDKKNMNIIIGGVSLSRGITYENLLTELFLYCPKNNPTVDVLLQRARWFGYRKKRCDYMNLITCSRIKDLYVNEATKYNNLIFGNNSNFINFDELKDKIKMLNDNLKLKGCANAKQ